jgi:hypothetical protein
MRTVVVFESMFGNTKEIAKAIGSGLSEHGAVDMVEVGTAESAIPAGVDLVVVGGPTHAHGMSRPGTRRGAENDEKASTIGQTRVGLRDWLARLERPPAGVAAAAFDTRFDKPEWLTGSAARGADRQLRRLGFDVLAPAESFFVAKSYGPLVDGELERARRWGSRLGAAAAGGGLERRAS